MFRLERLCRQINRGVEGALFGIGVSMAVVVAVQVFCRYVLNHSLFWSEELARYLLVWLTFLGTSAAYYRKLHPSIDFFYQRQPEALQYAATLFGHLISLTFFSVMVLFGVRFCYFVRLQISPALYLPKWIVFSIIPASGCILLLYNLAFIIHDVSRRRHGC